jgi:hypothetical protein
MPLNNQIFFPNLVIYGMPFFYINKVPRLLLLDRLLIHFQQLLYGFMKKRETKFLANALKNRQSLQQARRRL